MNSKYFILLLFPFVIWCEEDTIAHVPGTPQEGLSSLRRASAGQFQYNNSIDIFYAQHAISVIYFIEATYGITNSFALSCGIPIFLKKTRFEEKTAGLSDIFFTGEWTFFSVPSHLALLKGSIEFPTGDTKRLPSIASGTYDYIIELDTIHSSKKWYAEGLMGVKVNGIKDEIDFGDGVFFMLSWGPKFQVTDKSVITILGQMNGSSLGRNAVPQIADELFGSDNILLGPLVSWSNESLVALMLFQVPIGQKVSPHRVKNEFRLSIQVQCNF